MTRHALVLGILQQAMLFETLIGYSLLPTKLFQGHSLTFPSTRATS
jgi:hypothetical protein